MVVGHYSASELHAMQERERAWGKSLMHGPAGAPSDADLELRQTLSARARAAPASYSHSYSPFEPPPPFINVTAATPRPESIAEFDSSVSSGPPQQQQQQQPRRIQDSKAFLGKRLVSNVQFQLPAVAMDKLQVRSTEFSTVKAKAIEDARQMQAHVIEECTKAGKDPPPYGLVELIGKGSFGRVYMG
jgi:hypothetical protein